MQTAATSQSYPTLDREYLARFTLGNRELEREVLGLFAEHAPAYADRLATAATEMDWREAAHTLKGSAGAVGAVHVAKLAEAVERLQPLPVDAERAALLAPLVDAIETARATIAALSD